RFEMRASGLANGRGERFTQNRNLPLSKVVALRVFEVARKTERSFWRASAWSLRFLLEMKVEIL
ncbi:MAG: hypothetical protein ACRD9R_01530, partial [Pyrinomonadaceae bacterium]